MMDQIQTRHGMPDRTGDFEMAEEIPAGKARDIKAMGIRAMEIRAMEIQAMEIKVMEILVMGTKGMGIKVRAGTQIPMVLDSQDLEVHHIR